MTDTPLSDDVVERVARAIAAEDNEEDYDAWEANPSELGRRVWYEYARAALEAARYGEIAAAASALVAKLDECAPQVANLSAINFVRSGVQYTGPSYGDDLERLRALLSSIGESQP